MSEQIILTPCFCQHSYINVFDRFHEFRVSTLQLKGSVLPTVSPISIQFQHISHNLSSNFQLTSMQHQLFRKGLFFIPTLSSFMNQRQLLAAHLYMCHRCLKSWAFFEHQSNEEPSLLHPQSSWEPDSAKLPEKLLILFQMDSHTIWHFNMRILICQGPYLSKPFRITPGNRVEVNLGLKILLPQSRT